MNEKQRKLLSEQVSAQFKEKINQLKESISEPPSLQNYVVTELLNGTLKMKDPEQLKKELTKHVKKMSQKEVLIGTKSQHRYGRDDRDEEESLYLQIEPHLLFELPEAYIKALNDWKEHKKKTREKISQLNATLNTLQLKIQVGSAEKLQKLVDDIDNLGELRLLDSQLALESESPKNKAIES